MNIVFTKHAIDRLKKRKITKEEVERTIISPEKLIKEGGKYYANKNIGEGIIEVVYERENYIKVISLYWL